MISTDNYIVPIDDEDTVRRDGAYKNAQRRIDRTAEFRIDANLIVLNGNAFDQVPPRTISRCRPEYLSTVRSVRFLIHHSGRLVIAGASLDLQIIDGSNR